MGQDWGALAKLVDPGTAGRAKFCAVDYLQVVQQLEQDLENRKNPADKIAYLKSVVRFSTSEEMSEVWHESSETSAQTIKRLHDRRVSQIREGCPR